MRGAAVARPAAKDVWPQHASVGAQTKRKPPKDVGPGRCPPAPTRSARAEALVRHVAQLPAFLASAPAPVVPTPSLVGQYLEVQVAEVAAQLDAIRQAGNYGRLVLLLAELLDGDLAVGVTPRAVQSGILDLVHGCVAAIAKGETGVYPEQCSGIHERHTAGAVTTAGPHAPRSPGATFGSATTTARFGGGTVPIESLLPPLIDQPLKQLRDGGAIVTDDERAAAEMEMWESYMATARAATTAEEAMAIPTAAAAGATAGEAAAAGSCGADASVAYPFKASGAAASPAVRATALRSLPAALCAVIERCTAAPLVCLTLQDQRCQAAAVRDVLGALLAIMKGIDADAGLGVCEKASLVSRSSASSAHGGAATASAAHSLQTVRLTALKGIAQVLATYLDGAGAAPREAAPPSKSPDTLTAGLDILDVPRVFEDVTQQWAQTLALLAAEAGRGDGDDDPPVSGADSPSRRGGGGGSGGGGVSGSEGGDGAATQLHWLLRIAYQVIAAEQQEASSGGTRATPRTHLLPPLLIPVAVRTLSLVCASRRMACRAVSYAQLCVDVLWGASLLAPSESARQLVYGVAARPATTAAAAVTASGSGNVSAAHSSRIEANSPVTDLFLALLHQFNEGHSAAHCELRDDLVCLLANLLRYDTQYVEDELATRRGAGSGARRTSLDSLSCLSTSPSSAAAGVTPMSLSVATAEALNAVAALLFETTCGAELMVSPHSASSNAAAAADEEEATASALLSLDAARRHALRFQSIATSVARRRELLDFKICGWQLLEAHCSWQLAHLTYREYVHYHDTASHVAGKASAASAPHHHHHQRTAPVGQVTGEDAGDEVVTAALWGVQLSQLGFLDVLLLYVDTRTDEAAVVAWTREELLLLEVEAWQLLTSMILFAQHLDAKSGGLRVRRHRRYEHKPSSASLQLRRQRQSDGPSSQSVSLEAGGEPHDGDSDADDLDDDRSGVLYGADMHFIAAGGVQVALHYLRTAPREAEEVKRWALVTVAAIARTSSSGEAHGRSGTFTDKELDLVQTALTQHAPSLVPFLVKLIEEVDVHVDIAGVPAALPPVISSVAASMATAPRAWGRRPTRDGGNVHSSTAATVTAPHSGARWSWLPQSTASAALVAWCLLRCIGDVVLAEVGTVRELALPLLDDGAIMHSVDEESGGSKSPTSHVTGSEVSGARRGKDGNARLPQSRAVVNHEACDEQLDLSVAAASSSSYSSSSGSSMGPLEAGRADEDDVSNPSGRRSRSRAHSHDVGVGVSAGDTPPSHRRTLLRSVHSQVLRIPELFAEEGGVDLLTSWLRHIIQLCSSGLPEERRQHRHRQEPQQQQQQRRTRPPRPADGGADAVPQLTTQEIAELEHYSDVLLLLLDVFRAIVLGCKANETQFVKAGGVHGMLDLMEAYALAHGLIRQASQHARLTVAPDSCSTWSTSSAAVEHRETGGLLHYATTLLSDLLDSCPRAIDAFATWRSSRIALSPLTADVHECRLRSDDGIEAVQLLLCLWASEMPTQRSSSSGGGGSLGCSAGVEAAVTPSGLELLRLHLRPTLRTGLKEEYVCRLLRRRAKLGVLQAQTIRDYYHYLHTDTVAQQPAGSGEEDGVPDFVVLAYMERLMSRSSRRSAVAPEQQIALLVCDALGLCMKVYGCLATVGFDSLRAAEVETSTAPSMGVGLSSLERSFLIQVAALPALCVDEISVAMAQVALEGHDIAADADLEESGSDAEKDDVGAWRPTTPDRRVLRAAAEEASVRAGELGQLIEVGAQVQQARESQLYNRFLITQMRQPVGQPADGRPGAVKGAWKTQRRLSATRGSALVGTGGTPALSAADLAARLSTRLAAEQQHQQQRIASTARARQLFDGTNTCASVSGEQSTASALSAIPAVLGSARTPYAPLMDSVNAATEERLPATSFMVVAPPRQPTVPLTQRRQQRQAMIARSLRKLPLDRPALPGPSKQPQ
ncbi:hypothetical protein NESM_000711100 [Novymonas esmeraldas]|uniref:Separase n=1 Tax=Novymonas esmeraldas TaxID=1808958 RepID=A0AAW0ETM9_9TRYP